MKGSYYLNFLFSLFILLSADNIYYVNKIKKII